MILATTAQGARMNLAGLFARGAEAHGDVFVGEMILFTQPGNKGFTLQAGWIGTRAG